MEDKYIEELVLDPAPDIAEDFKWMQLDSSSSDETEDQKKRHLNAVLIGHVDAGKSTIGGQLLYLSGQIDDHIIEKYKKEAKEKGRDMAYMAYIMDTDEHERAEGNTVRLGRDNFETKSTRVTIFDAPGLKICVPEMISGASQADIGVLVISAREGEFETGYERGGQTREHVQLAFSFGVYKLLVVVNKMDDPTVKWAKERFDEIESKMITLLKSLEYDVKKDVQFLPISGLLGTNMKTRMDKSVCPWWNGPCLFEALDAIEVPARDPDAPFKMLIFDKAEDEDERTFVMGKIEFGSVREGDMLMIMPNEVQVRVVAIFIGEDKVRSAGPGENVEIMVTGIYVEDIRGGSVLCCVANPVLVMSEFIAHLKILELPDPIFCVGYKAVLHMSQAVEECEIIQLIDLTHPIVRSEPLTARKGDSVVCHLKVDNPVCAGYFCIRKEGETVAVEAFDVIL